MDLTSLEINKVTRKSIKWSFLGEFFAKIAAPISTMILARLLSPEIFGIATAVTLVVTFCETVTEGGFAKYIIQKDFENENDYKNSFSISIYTSFALSILLCVLVFFFRVPLSAAVGNRGYEMVLVVSSVQIPLAAINALYSADLRRRFGFKKLFYVRIIYALVPFIVTVPLAALGFGYWSLVIGTIGGQLFEIPFLIILCRGRLKFYFSFKLFKKILKNSFPMILESIIIWLCTWTGTIIAANFFNSTVVGIVKVSSSTVNNIFALFAVSFTSVLFPALSRLKDDEKTYKEIFYSVQGAALAVLVPLGLGMYYYSRLITDIFLGKMWADAAFVIGIYSLTRPLMICFNNFISEVYRSKGHFYSSIFYQLAMLAVDILLKFTIGKVSYELFIWSTVFCNIFTTFLAIAVLRIKYGFVIKKQMKSLLPAVATSIFMIPILFVARDSTYSIAVCIAQVICCVVLYFSLLKIIFPKVFDNAVSYVIKRS